MDLEAPRQSLVLPARQIHLDFHTAPDIPDVGRDFDPDEFAQILKDSHVNSVTVFAKCHHGMSYYPTSVGIMHPSLSFDLLGTMIDSLHRAGIRAPIYISVCWDEYMADQHPEWLQVDHNGCFVGKRPFDVYGWRLLDLASPYAEYVLSQTEEILRLYGPIDGIFFDIVFQDLQAIWNRWRIKRLRGDGVDPRDTESVARWGLQLERAFMARAYSLVKQSNPEASVFFNGRLRVDRDPSRSSRSESHLFTHFEIESLPTGRWGYNHFPLFASFFQTLGLPLVGMTGIFHTSWGDFGSLKPQTALDYECSRMVAFGAACSIGDQLHPRGRLDATAYQQISRVYSRLERLETWLQGLQPVPEIGVLLAQTANGHQSTALDSDEGALRMLLELHHTFQFIDSAADFSRYKLLLLPDDVPLTNDLVDKVTEYLATGGKLLLTHRSGLNPEGDRFAMNFGVEYLGLAPHNPDYLVPLPKLLWPETTYPLVLYERGSRVSPNIGCEILAMVGYPYFTRSFDRYMSHRQTPFHSVSDDPAIIRHGSVIYCHTPFFRAYRRYAVPAYRHIIGQLINLLLPDRLIQSPNLPTTAEVTVWYNAHHDYYILHILHAVPQRRGSELDIIEDVLPLRDIRLGLRTNRQTRTVMLLPDAVVLESSQVDGVTWVTVPEVRVHGVLVFS
jgi:hypothetical protein